MNVRAAQQGLRSFACAAMLLAPVAWAAMDREPPVDDLPHEGSGPVQAILDETLEELGLANAVRSGRLGIALVQLDGDAADGVGLANGHRMFYAASLPKIVILYGAAVSLERERITLDEPLHDDLVAMIRRSCNPCANRVLDRIGRDWLVQLVEAGPHDFWDPEIGGLWVGKDFSKRPAFRRDPLRGMSHAATPWQAARFYYLLIRGELVDPDQTSLMLEALSDPAIEHKFVKGLANRDVKRLYRKSGTWRQHHADSVLVVAEGGSYILVALARDERGGRWLERLAPALHDRLLEAP